MSKFAGAPARLPTGPITTVPKTAQPFPITTHEGAPALTRDRKSDLFLLAAVNMVGEDTFYEAAGARDARFRELVHAVAIADPGWIAGFLPYLRNQMQMRSASVVMAAEFAWQRTQIGTAMAELPDGVTVRSVVESALQRPDEPAELLGYWKSRYGRSLPAGVKRGVADAVTRMLSEKAAIKYDGQSRAYRLGDVLEVVHPKPKGVWQSEMFRWLLNRRRHNDAAELVDRFDPAILPTIAAYEELRLMPKERQRELLLANPELLGTAGLTWEHLSGLGPMDAAAWEAVIPQMGYMALLRNLRNFDQAGISDVVASTVAARLADPSEVARSRQFPYRFLSAFLALDSVRWAPALEQALQQSVSAIPEFPGRTLVLVDTSASMRNHVSAKSRIRHIDIAALFGCAVATRNPGRTTLVGFADGAFEWQVPAGASALLSTQKFDELVGSVGHGTQMLGAIAAAYNGHDRIVLFSDLQCAPYLTGRGGYYGAYGQPHRSLEQIVPAGTQVFAVNTGGYGSTPVDSAVPGYYELAGFSDRLFTMIAALAAGTSVSWPWEQA